MQNRDRFVAARVTADEEALFRELAQARGVSVSDQLREAALKYATRTRAAMKSRDKSGSAAA